MASIVLDLSDVNFDQFESKVVGQELVYYLQYTYVIELSPKAGILQVKAMFGGKAIGHTRLKIDDLEGHIAT